MTDPVTSSWTNIPSAEGHFGGYLALPPSGRGPGLVLLQEIFGVNPHIQAVARQYALDGFVVLAPDLFWRQHPRVSLGYEGADREQAYGLMQSITPEGAMADLQASMAALRARPECSGKLATLGYCMGGRLAFAAATQAGVDAAVAYYGGGIQNQLVMAPQIQCPVQFHFGERDDHIPLSAVEQVRSAMAGKPHECHVYPGAQHGFNCWARTSFDARSAVLAHARTLAFLAPLF